MIADTNYTVQHLLHTHICIYVKSCIYTYIYTQKIMSVMLNENLCAKKLIDIIMCV